MPAGRPSEYKTEFIEKVDEYLKTVGREQTTLPTREGFAQFIGVDTDTLVEWDKQENKKEFSVALKKITELQRQQLMNDGMYGGKEVNSAMAIFLLKANHGLIETNRQEITGKDGEPVSIISYGNNDPLQLRSQSVKFAGDPRFTTPGTLSSTQLAQKSEENDTSGESTDPLG